MTPERRAMLRRRLRRVALWGMACVLALLVVVELVARIGFGLCDPPLLAADPEMEYVFKPDQRCRQFGNEIDFNHYSMRSPDFPKSKSTTDEFRVMVIGDSVVFGGTKVDQRDLATSRLQSALAAAMKRPVVVGNVGAGSWGPPNMLGYVRKHGFFEADVIVVVLSSHDAGDTMSFEPVVGIDPSYPDKKPTLAMYEIATRYLPRFLAIRRQAATAPPPPEPVAPGQIDASMSALRELLAAARRTGARVIVAQHLEQPELDGTPMPGHDTIRSAAESCEGVEVIQLGPAMKAARDRGEQPYRDFIHPSPNGQGVIAGVLREALLAPATAPVSRPAPAASAPSPASRPQ